MKKTLLLIVIFLFTININCQEGWYFQSGGIFSDIQFLSTNVGYALGTGLSIYKSEDGGDSWEGLYTGTDLNYTTGGGAIYFLNTSIGWAVQGKNIIKTTNGGSSWKIVEPSINLFPSQLLNLTDVFFTDYQHGFCVGMIGNVNGADQVGVLIKTFDGGETWIREDYSYPLNSVFFANSSKGWVGGNLGTMLFTSDGGATWTNQTIGNSVSVRDVAFRDENFGLAASYGSILKTTNGGANWESIVVTGSGALSSVSIQSSNCFAMGAGKLFKSVNSGDTWNLLADFEIYLCDKIFFFSSNLGWFASAEGIAKTEDGGNNWTQKTPNKAIETLKAIKGLNKVFAVQRGGLAFTEDGKKWKFFLDDRMKNIYDISFKDGLNGWLVGGYNLVPNVLRTTDGGYTWENQNINISQNILAMQFVNSTYGWMVGTNGTIIKTLDGGETWGPQNSQTVSHLYDVSFINENVGYAVGKGTYGTHWGYNVVLKTLNGGLLWDVVNASKTDGEYHRVFCFDENTLIVNKNDTLFLSSDAGSTLSKLYVSPYGIAGITFTNRYTGYLSNYMGTYKTVDGGAHWSLSSNYNLSMISFSSDLIGWGNISGYGIIYTSDGGVNSVETETVNNKLPDNFVLQQNYPNPFNPATTIEYSIPEASFVSLKVYDILGKEIETLVEDYVSPGNYKSTWNANSLSSGVYFYRLNSGNVSVVRKMCLIK